MPRRQSVAIDSQTAADEFLAGQDRPDIFGLIDLQPEQWETLSEAIRAERWSDLAPFRLLADDETRQLLRTALPGPLQEKFEQYARELTARAEIAAEAGFLVGLRYGR